MCGNGQTSAGDVTEAVTGPMLEIRINKST